MDCSKSWLAREFWWRYASEPCWTNVSKYYHGFWGYIRNQKSFGFLSRHLCAVSLVWFLGIWWSLEWYFPHRQKYRGGNVSWRNSMGWWTSSFLVSPNPMWHLRLSKIACFVCTEWPISKSNLDSWSVVRREHGKYYSNHSNQHLWDFHECLLVSPWAQYLNYFPPKAWPTHSLKPCSYRLVTFPRGALFPCFVTLTWLRGMGTSLLLWIFSQNWPR